MGGWRPDDNYYHVMMMAGPREPIFLDTRGPLARRARGDNGGLALLPPYEANTRSD
jgi:hypothetical protein